MGEKKYCIPEVSEHPADRASVNQQSCRYARKKKSIVPEVSEHPADRAFVNQQSCRFADTYSVA
jgi:hypothetical protein